jgi:hypothetical protein
MQTLPHSKSLCLLVLAGLIVVLLALRPTLASGSRPAQDDEKKSVVDPPGKVPADKPDTGQDDTGNADKDDEPERILSRFMRQKLQASTLILEGLCTEDLERIQQGTETLLKMSHEEQWRVSNDVMYRRYSREFVSAVEELKKEAEDGDMDGTSMSWVNVTMKCLKCHEWVRNTVLADGAAPIAK